jgi:hypothetical protein
MFFDRAAASRDSAAGIGIFQMIGDYLSLTHRDDRSDLSALRVGKRQAQPRCSGGKRFNKLLVHRRFDIDPLNRET